MGRPRSQKVLVLAVALIIALFVTDRVRSQLQLATADISPLSNVMLPTDRQSTRHLSQADQLVTAGQYGDAALLLDRILSSKEDAFVHSTSNKSEYQSVKSEALRRIGTLSAEGLASYRLQFGARAQNMLDDAIERGDFELLESLSRRYFHTLAGYEATLLLGQHCLDAGRPQQAAVILRRLIDNPQAEKVYGADLYALAATSWLRAGHSDRAAEVITTLRQRYPGKTISIAGKPIGPFPSDKAAIAWFENEFALPASETLPEQKDWTVFRGNASRTAASDGGRPILTPRWRQRMAGPGTETLVQNIQEHFATTREIALPSLQPLAIGDVVLARTVSDLVAVDFRTGRLVWQARTQESDALSHVLELSNSRNHGQETAPLVELLRQRLWRDAIYGTISSDSERVFVIEDVSPYFESPPRLIAPRIIFRRQDVRQEVVPVGNRLAAFELKTEGKLVWQLGGADGEDAQLESAFFLGAPLPVDGQLYVLAEIKNGIRLLVLDAATGKVNWSQHLADVERDAMYDAIWRLTGATPSLADGVVVCPTGAGAVVAVDVGKRCLLWAYKYPLSTNAADVRMGFRVLQQRQQSDNDHWQDGSVTISEGRVLLTPVQSDKLYCLDLHTGKLQWERPRDEGLYVASVHDGRAIIVAQGAARGEARGWLEAIDLASGKRSWDHDACLLPEDSVPSGRGFYADGFYYLPLTSAEVAKIDLENGQIVDRRRSRDGVVPGNLICHRGNVISQSGSFLDAFYQVEPLREQVAKRLADNADDAEALAHRGELALEDGDLDTAIESFRRSFAIDRNELAREKLIENLLIALAEDFEFYESVAPELDALIAEPVQRTSYYRVMAEGLHASGRRSEALSFYLKLVDLDLNQAEMLELDADLEVRIDRWIQTQLIQLAKDATVSERSEIDEVIASHKSLLDQNAREEDLRRFLRHFGDVGDHDDVRLRLAKTLLDQDNLLECEALAMRLEESSNPTHRRAANALMAKLLRRAGRDDDAEPYCRRLQSQWPDVVCLDGKTGTQVLEELNSGGAALVPKTTTRDWPAGKVVVEKLPRDEGVNRGVSLAAFRFGDGAEPFFQNVDVMLEVQGPAIVGRDGLGRETFRAGLGEGAREIAGLTRSPSHDVRRATARGHLLICSLGEQVAALDTLGKAEAADGELLWRKNLTSEFELANSRRRVVAIRAPGGFRRVRVTNGNDVSLGTLGPVTVHGAIFAQTNDVFCVDSLTGEEAWIVHNMTPGSELFGDDDYLFIVPPDSGRNDVEATVVRTRDGRRLGQRSIPPAKERLAFVGRRLLQMTETGGKLTVRLYDPWSRKNVWEPLIFPGDSKIDLVDEHAVAVMQRSGLFQMFSVKDGTNIISQQLEREPTLTMVRVEKTRDHYLLLVAHGAPQPGNNQERIYPIEMDSRGFPLFTGRIYLFDRKSGEPVWPAPVVLQNRGWLFSQPIDLPVITFAEQHGSRRPNGQRTNNLSLMCLDKRTGRLVFQESGLSNSDRPLSWTCDVDEKTVTLSMRNGARRMTFTDEPISPEPPYQDDVRGSPDSGKPGNIFDIFSGSRSGRGVLPGSRSG